MFGLGLRSCFTRQYIDKSTPSTVVASAFDTSGNNGRKIVRLTNGWLICVVMNSTTSIIAYKWQPPFSDGSWIQLFTIEPSLYGLRLGCSIATDGVNCVLFYAQNTNYFKSFKFDPTTVSNTNQDSNAVQIFYDSGFGTNGNTSITYANGAYHCAFSSRSSTYQGTFNIFYSKSTNGTTWDVATQINPNGGTGVNKEFPCVVVMSNGYPLVVCADTFSNDILAITYNGATWSVATIYSGGAYIQARPNSTVSTSDGHIHVSWHGWDSTYPSQPNILYVESTNNGASWTAKSYITSGNTIGNTEPSITVDRQNNVYIVYNRGYIAYKKFDGTAWGAETQLTTTGASPSTCSNYLDYIKPMTVYRDTAAVKFVGAFYA